MPTNETCKATLKPFRHVHKCHLLEGHIGVHKTLVGFVWSAK